MWVRKVGWRYGYKVVVLDLYGTTDADIAKFHYFKGVRFSSCAAGISASIACENCTACRS